MLIMVSVSLLYRAPFDALITYMTVFVLPDTKTFWAFGAQHFIRYQFSCLLMYSANPHITFEIQPRGKSATGMWFPEKEPL